MQAKGTFIGKVKASQGKTFMFLLAIGCYWMQEREGKNIPDGEKQLVILVGNDLLKRQYTDDIQLLFNMSVNDMGVQVLEANEFTYALASQTLVVCIDEADDLIINQFIIPPDIQAHSVTGVVCAYEVPAVIMLSATFSDFAESLSADYFNIALEDVQAFKTALEVSGKDETTAIQETLRCTNDTAMYEEAK